MPEIREIRTEEEMRRLLDDSFASKAVLFKYSPTCGISLAVQERWEEWASSAPSSVILARCDVLAARPAARGITTWLDMLHQSPQVLVLESGKCLAHTSHYSIDAGWLEKHAG